jgi:hypothetical protein
MKIQMTPFRLLTKAEAAHNVPFGTWMFSYEQSGPRRSEYSHEQQRVAGKRGQGGVTEGVAHAAERFFFPSRDVRSRVFRRFRCSNELSAFRKNQFRSQNRRGNHTYLRGFIWISENL